MYQNSVVNFVSLILDIANCWLETLLDVIDLLPKDVIKKEVSFALN